MRLPKKVKDIYVKAFIDEDGDIVIPTDNLGGYSRIPSNHQEGIEYREL